MHQSNDNATAVEQVLDTGKSRFSPGRPLLPAYLTPGRAKLLIAYAGAGCIGTAAHFAILYAALNALGTVAASTLGAIAGCLVNFSLSRRFVFSGRQSAHHALPRFLAVAGLAIVLNAVVMKALIATLPLFLSQAISITAVFVFTFTFNNGWTFSERHP